MFTIIGGDGREYGPVAASQIRSWIVAGRANLDTKAKAAGTEEWRRLGDFAEFGVPATPPPLPPAGDYPAASAHSSPSYAPGTAAYATESVRTAELAGRGERLLAQLLDNVIGFAFALPGLVMMGIAIARAGLSMSGGLSNLATAAGFSAGVLVSLAALFVLAVIQLWMLVSRGQTLGKRALGIRIVSFDDESNPGFVKVFLLRAFMPAVIGSIPYVGILFTLADICFIFRDDHRCIHDLMAGTKVVKA